MREREAMAAEAAARAAKAAAPPPIAPPDAVKFDAAETEKAIGACQREVRERLAAHDFVNASEACDDLCAGAVHAYGEERNPILAAALNDKAVALKGLGKFEEAVAVLAGSVQLYESCGMHNHASTATALHNMGATYKENAVLAVRALERMQLLDRASETLLESIVRRSGARDFDANGIGGAAVATTRVVLASVLRLQKKPADSHRELNEAIVTLRRHRDLYPKSASAATGLAAALNNAALYAKRDGAAAVDCAKTLYEEALQLRHDALGATHPQTVETMHNLAEYHIANGQHLEAATLQNAILDNFGVER